MIETYIFREICLKAPTVFLQIAFAHDSTRVIQCYIQFGNEEQRKQAFEELRGISYMYFVIIGIKLLVFSWTTQTLCWKRILLRTSRVSSAGPFLFLCVFAWDKWGAICLRSQDCAFSSLLVSGGYPIIVMYFVFQVIWLS